MAEESRLRSIVIRSFQPSDLTACQTIFTAGHLSYNSPMVYINEFLEADMADIEKSFLQIPNGHFWVAVSTDDNRVVGHVGILPLKLADPSCYYRFPDGERDEIGELVRMSVSFDVQRAGVGTKLLETLIGFAREKRYHQIHLTTLTNMDKACAFYEKNGFIKGQFEIYRLEQNPPLSIEEMKTCLSNLPKPIFWEADAIISDEDRRLMKLPPIQSGCYYVQHYFLPL